MGLDPGNSDSRRNGHDFLLNIVETFFLDTRDEERQTFKRKAYETWLQSLQRKQILKDAEIESLKKLKEQICAVLDKQIRQLQMGIE